MLRSNADKAQAMKLGALVFGLLVVGFASQAGDQTTIVVPNGGGGFTASGRAISSHWLAPAPLKGSRFAL
jgi:hypothetical protein